MVQNRPVGGQVEGCRLWNCTPVSVQGANPLDPGDIWMLAVEVAGDGFHQDREGWSCLGGGTSPAARGSAPPSDRPSHCRCPASASARAPQSGVPSPPGYSWVPPLPPPRMSTGRPALDPASGPTFLPHPAAAILVDQMDHAVHTRSAPLRWSAAPWPSAPSVATRSCTRRPNQASPGSFRSDRPRARRIRCARQVCRPCTQCQYTP